MLEDQIRGRNQSWAIRWCASAYVNDMYTLYPGTPMVSLIGNDGSGTHGSTDHRYDVIVSSQPIDMTLAPDKVVLSKEGYESFKTFFISVSSIRYKVYRIISLLLGHRSEFFLRNDLI